MMSEGVSIFLLNWGLNHWNNHSQVLLIEDNTHLSFLLGFLFVFFFSFLSFVALPPSKINWFLQHFWKHLLSHVTVREIEGEELKDKSFAEHGTWVQFKICEDPWLDLIFQIFSWFLQGWRFLKWKMSTGRERKRDLGQAYFFLLEEDDSGFLATGAILIFQDFLCHLQWHFQWSVSWEDGKLF